MGHHATEPGDKLSCGCEYDEDNCCWQGDDLWEARGKFLFDDEDGCIAEFYGYYGERDAQHIAGLHNALKAAQNTVSELTVSDAKRASRIADLQARLEAAEKVVAMARAVADWFDGGCWADLREGYEEDPGLFKASENRIATLRTALEGSGE